MNQNAPKDDTPDSSVQPADTADGSAAAQRWHLFLVGFLVLFLELACIRWFSVYVVFLQFFTNIVLIACFLGSSAGCLCATSKTDWLRRLPAIALVSVFLAILVDAMQASSVQFSVNSPQVVFFGTESPDVDLARFVVPIEFVAGLFFLLITLMFVGLGQVLGQCFNAYPNHVVAYALNIAGSLAGILCFAAASAMSAPPVVWFFAGLTGVGYLLKCSNRLTRERAVLLAATVLLVGIAGWRANYSVYWSPYYAVKFDPSDRHIVVNSIGHQEMVDYDDTGAVYSLIHLLQRHAGAPEFQETLIIGAGSGNDVVHHLKNDVKHIDAVEIDPMIQRLGKAHHPNHPYDDPRVDVHLTDGRHFLRETDRRYDLVTYALVDSLILHSSYSNIRLESFLFTKQAFADVKSVLKPDGVFVMYNYFRQGWIVERIVRMLTEVFGAEPIVVSLPYADHISPADNLHHQVTVMIAGKTDAIQNAFADYGAFWLNQRPEVNLRADGFAVTPNGIPEDERGDWLRIAPASVGSAPSRSGGEITMATDNWPFLYLRSPSVPFFYVRVAGMLILVSIAVLIWLAPGHRLGFNGRMFFLGAGFLLIETKAVVHLALVFGSTWFVNAMVFFAILVMILLSNLYVLRVGRIDLRRHYAALFLCLAVNCIVPLDIFLTGGVVWRYVLPCMLVMAPIVFAGVVFAVSFRASERPDRDFGANIAGAVVGGLAEYASMLLGFRYLMLVAMAFYALSSIFRMGGNRSADSS